MDNDSAETDSDAMDVDYHSDQDPEWSEESDNDEDEDQPKSNRNYNEYFWVISMGMRLKLSNRQISNMANAMLLDQVCTDERMYLTPSKVKRLRKKVGLRLSNQHQQENSKLEVIGFDGKTSEVLAEHCQTERHDKITSVDLIRGSYLGHDIPSVKTGYAIANSLHQMLVKHDSVESLKGVASDGENTNTGHSKGVLRFLQLLLGRPLQQIICLSHAIELVLRKVIFTVGKNEKSQKMCLIILFIC